MTTGSELCDYWEFEHADVTKGRDTFSRISNYTYESRRVVVTSCLGVSVSFQDGVGLDDLVF